MQHNVSFARACTYSLTHTKTDYRYSGIKDTLLPGDSLLLVLTLFNITFTCTTYGAVSVLIWVSCKRAVCLVKSGNRNTNGDGVEMEVAEQAVQSRSGRIDSFVDPSGQLFDRHFIFRLHKGSHALEWPHYQLTEEVQKNAKEQTYYVHEKGRANLVLPLGRGIFNYQVYKLYSS